jgi:hypothetical protein
MDDRRPRRIALDHRRGRDIDELLLIEPFDGQRLPHEIEDRPCIQLHPSDITYRKIIAGRGKRRWSRVAQPG